LITLALDPAAPSAFPLDDAALFALSLSELSNRLQHARSNCQGNAPMGEATPTSASSRSRRLERYLASLTTRKGLMTLVIRRRKSV